jgi:HD-GYP domain-containing protein (c-di-GMP phosphodiesterase class II)
VTGLSALTTAMDVADPDLGGHAARVGRHAEAIASRLGWDDHRLEHLQLGAMLHDVGKVRIRATVLAKPGRLTGEELAEIRAHPVEGLWMLSGLPALAPALPYVLFHHERWDGTGYPTRRRGHEIPIEGRVMAVADAFDAMTSERPYRAALPVDAALAEVRRCAGSQFDPDVAAAFVEAVECGDVPHRHAA